MECYLGLDLGQTTDYTAVALLEPGTRWDGISPAWHVRHLERMPRGVPYPAQVERIGALLTAIRGTPILHRQSPTGPRTELRTPHLIVDATGVGRAVFDMFTDAQMAPIGVTITGGDTPSREGTQWRIPKRDLVGVLQVLLQSQRLQIAEALPDARILTSELLNFQVTFTEQAHDRYEGRSGTHDDLVLAVALAAYFAERSAGRTGGSRQTNYLYGT